MGESLGSAVLVRYSELAVKGPATRRRMENLLVSALEEALRRRGVGYERVERVPGRVIVWGAGAEGARAAARVFGVKSASPSAAYRFSGLEDIVEEGARLFSGLVRGRVFRVRARRSGEHSFTSKDVERLLGARLLELGAARVDLESPEVTVYVEIRGDTAFYYSEVVEGPGGLPLGSEEPVLALYSGGFDSTVASWLVMRRGSPVGLAFYNLGVEEALETALEAAGYVRREWVHYGGLRMFVVDFTGVARTVRSVVSPGYVLLVLRRLMMEHACGLAEAHGYEALATGESIGQVSSQTVRNMRLIGSGLCLPVLRPVSGMDKDEVMGLARRIGVYDIVSRQVEQCRGRPVPRASPRIFQESLRAARSALSGVEPSVRVVDL